MQTETLIIHDAAGRVIYCPLEPVYAEALGLAADTARAVRHEPCRARPRYAPISEGEKRVFMN